MNIPDVAGIGIGLAEDGEDYEFVVYVEKLSPQVKRQVSKELEGVRVRLKESGPFEAY